MQLIDTHIHIYAEEYDQDRHQLIDQARTAGVHQLLLPNIDHTSISGMHQLVTDFPGVCYAMMGLHPCYVKENYLEELQQIEQLLRSGKYIGVGEIGMDKYWELDFIKQQEDALIKQLQWAEELQLPVALHTRNANDEVLSIIQSLKLKNLRGVFHCFSGTIEQAQQMIELGFYLGIGGVVTFKNSGLDKILDEIDLKHIVLETDGPYLAPIPYRGKRNEPAYLRLIAEKISEIKKCSLADVASITTANAKQLFAL
jgi:TatD DNase family protein